jgi:DNA modification methylase
MTYEEFIAAKINLDSRMGFEVAPEGLHPLLKPHQKDIVRWAVRGGRRAIFAAFGLGKSFMQLEIMRQIAAREGGKQLIIAPLGVRQEFGRDAPKLGLSIRFIRRNEELSGPGLYITNYESIRDGRLSVEHFNAASLDEASVLRSYGSLTFRSFLTLFSSVKYRFVATATPSPNRYKELIHYAGFLGIMDTGESLTRFFKRDSTQANNLTLHGHKEKEFWYWVNSWAIFLQKPSDLGYSDEGYILPELHVHYHMVQAHSKETKDKRGQFRLMNDAALSLTAASREKRDSLSARIEKMKEIVESIPNEHCIIWHDQENERHAIKKAIPTVVDIYGSMDIEVRENRVIDFSDGKIKLFASKPILSGSGCNFQRHCHMAIFLGIGFKFNDFIQAIHRIYRFLQEKECHIHIIYANTELRILDALKRKWLQHEDMVNKMTEIIKKHGLSHIEMENELHRTIGVQRIEVRSKYFTAINNDCVKECRKMESDSVDLIHTSVPFSNHYEYTPSYNDFGHTGSNDHFWSQMDYLTPELLRILKPGRIYACHTKDRILFGNVTGAGVPTSSPFHAEAIFHCKRHGFDYLGMITVVTDVVRENNQTYRLGWSEQCKDGTKMGVGSPEYIILLRKPQTDRTKGYADIPVTKGKSEYTRARWQIDAHAFWRSSGDRALTADEMAGFGPDVLARVFTENSLKDVYDYEEHVRIGEELDLRGALPCAFMSLAPGSHHADVWHDVNRMLTLNGNQTQQGLNNHICPLQLDIVDRIINRYSNPGELVFDPFAGLMTVPYRAIKLNRRGYGVELNPEYFMDGVKYLRAAELEKSMPSLLDFCKQKAV